METKKLIKNIAVVGIAVMLGATLTGCTGVPTLNGEPVTQEILDAALNAAKVAGVNSVDITADNAEAVNSAFTEAGITVESVEEMKESIVNYEQIIADYETAEAEVEAEESIFEMELASAWTSDELDLARKYLFEFSDRKIDKLFDGEVEFDGDDYDAEEALTLTDIELAINGEDFAEDVYMAVLDGGIKYEFTIDSDLNVSEIGEDDETLVLNFLGESIEIVEWTANEITVIRGTEYDFEEGQTQEINGNTIQVLAITDDNDGSFAYVIVNGKEGDKVYEGSSQTIDGLKIQANNVVALHNLDRTGFATLRIGEKVEETFEDGDEFEEDSIWEWIIDGTTNTLGVVLAEDFKVLNDREGHDVMGAGESISLPNDYLTITFNGIEDEDMETYDFELDDNAIVIAGQFISGLNDYDEVFVNISNGIIYEDDDLTLPIATPVYFGDSAIALVVNATTITIGDITIGINLDSINVNGTPLTYKEDNYINAYGIIIETPEDAIDDQEITIVIPEEQLYGTITVD